MTACDFSFCLWNILYSPVFRFIVMSRKLATLLFHSIVMLSQLFFKNLNNFFLTFSNLTLLSWYKSLTSSGSQEVIWDSRFIQDRLVVLSHWILLLYLNSHSYPILSTIYCYTWVFCGQLLLCLLLILINRMFPLRTFSSTKLIDEQ